MPNAFSTPAQRLGITFLAAKKEEREDRAAVFTGVKGAASGAVIGAGLGHSSGLGSKVAKEHEGLRRRRMLSPMDTLRLALGEKVAKPQVTPFKKGKFGSGERLARAEHEAGVRVGKTVRNRAIGGGVAGAVLAGGLSYAAARATRPAPAKKKQFHTPASRMLVELDSNAADAGWDIRDPRGKSARVFAPGSRKRVRREKGWSEEVGNERKLWKGAVIGAGLLAAAGGVAVGRRFPKKAGVTKAAEKIVPFPVRKRG